MKILIYDEEERFKNKLEEAVRAQSLEDDSEVRSMSDEEVESLLKQLGERRISLRRRGEWSDEGVPLDEADIFIVDYDLAEQDRFDRNLTGEDIAHFARCFSECGLIVGVNQFRNVDFDLTLKGHPESFADLNVNEVDQSKQLSNPNLWGKRAGGFHPWHWPALPQYQRNFGKKVRDVRENLDVPIWQVLGFPIEQFEILPLSIVQFLGGAKPPDEITFRDFVVESGNGLQAKDAQLKDRIDDDVIARVGAARISKWLERFVLPHQTILMDAPHLVSQYPSLLDGDATDIGTWNATAQRTSYDNLGLNVDLIEQFRFKKEYWLSRPVWFRDGLRKWEDILEVREPWMIDAPDWLFCVDASQFYIEEYQEFVAETEPPFPYRFVKRFGDVKYSPQSRLLM
jgi:hypothetical protein